VGGPEGDEFQSSWSPDATRITFDTDRDGNWEIYTVLVGGGGLKRLTNNPALDDLPVWRP
jgi:Tol biopolymer transport system component